MDQVRIKDKMRSAYTPQQWMGVQIEKIKAARFSETLELEGWMIREAIYHRPGDYEWLDQQWRPYQIGDEWGGENRTAFFRCGAKVPKNFDGKYCVLYLKPGGEGLLTLNGKQLAGLDSKHEVIFLAEQMNGGETLQIEIEQYVNEMEIPKIIHQFSVAELAVLDRDIEDAYFDLKCAYDIVMTPQAANEVRAFLFDELKKAISLIDFEEDGEKFRASLMKARSYVRENIYNAERFKHHGRLNMVGHSHLDFVYQWDYNEFLRKIGRTHATTLNMMREFPDYLFCQSQMKLYEDLKSLYPEIYDGIKERVKDGRWEVIGGMYVEPDCNLISGESFVRQLQFGREFALREFGTTSSVCWLPDVFGIAWFIPQILKRAGFRFLITNKPVIWNDTNEFPHNTFWWEGPDGSRILAHLPATHFGASIDADVMLTNWNEYKQKVACNEAIYNYGYADGRGGPNREDVLTGRRYKNMPGMPESLFTHGQEAFKRIEANVESLPVWKDELYLETHRGTYTTQARLKKKNRKAEILYRNAEAMSAWASLLGGSYPGEDLHEGWKLILKNQFHDILPGSHVTQAFHDAVKDYETVFEKGNQALASALSYIGNQIGSEPAAVAVFNMQPWERTDVVEAEFKAAPEPSFKIVDANGNNVPFQVLSQDDGQVRVLIEACNVPPMGYTVYRLVEGKPEASTSFMVHDDSIENDVFRVRFDGQGTITGIYDKKNNRQVIEEGNRLQLFEDVPGRYAAWDIVPMYKDREFEVPPVERSEIVENGAARLVLRQERSLMKSKMVQNIILYRSLPRIDFETEIEWGERDRLLKAGFLVNVNAMRATYDISYGYIERPTHANTSWDAAKFEVCGHLWADLSEGDYGVSLLNDCKYGYDIFGNRMRLTLLRGPQSPDPTADLGHHSFTYSLYPHRGDWRQGKTPRRAWELNDPLMAIPIRGGEGNLKPTGSFLSIVSDHVMISALKMAEKGDGLILRLYEDQNRRGTVNVTFFHPPSRATECDPYENEIGQAEVVSGCLRFDIKPFEVRTFKLHLPVYEDFTLSIEKRVDNLVSRMTLKEKVSQLLHDAPAIERLDVPKYNWWSECLHGVGRAGIATVFPQAIGLGATWNTKLMHRVAVAISDEARAKHHEALRKGIRQQYLGLTFWSPNINIFRDPRWGRGQETYGEDPYLTSRMGVAFVKGLQGDDPRYLKLVATPKHFAVHSGPEHERHHFDAQVDERDLRETYLPAFEACVKEAKAASVMGAYNRTNGEPCCASPTLLEQILRQEWAFDGYVVSDCGAIGDIYRHHKVVETAPEAAAMAVKAGCDLNCGQTYDALLTAVEKGLISEETIDRAVKRLFTARFRLGMFDLPEQVPYAQIPYKVNDSPEHRALALRAAQESIVLLKNEGRFLPLNKDLKSIAVIGPNANDVQVLLGNYHGMPSKAVTPLEGIRAKVSPETEVLYAQGCDIIDNDTEGYAEAVSLAERADVVIFVAGLSQRIEGEEGQREGVPSGMRSQGDRTGLDLPSVQEELLKAMHATGTPVVLVLINGSALSVNWASEYMPAIVEAWYPGEEGGTAIADVLFGDYNPGGRLPVTFYRSVEDLPPFEDYGMKGRTYRYFRGEPLFPFGYGLSYTTFAYSNLQLSDKSITPGETLIIRVNVQNVGQRAGDEVVQLYVSDIAARSPGPDFGEASTVSSAEPLSRAVEGSVPLPIRQLQGFERIHLAPGETKTITFTLTPRQLSRIDDAGRRVIEPGEFQVAVGGRQPNPEDFIDKGTVILIGTFEVTGKVTGVV